MQTEEKKGWRARRAKLENERNWARFVELAHEADLCDLDALDVLYQGKESIAVRQDKILTDYLKLGDSSTLLAQWVVQTLTSGGLLEWLRKRREIIDWEMELRILHLFSLPVINEGTLTSEEVRPMLAYFEECGRRTRRFLLLQPQMAEDDSIVQFQTQLATTQAYIKGVVIRMPRLFKRGGVKIKPGDPAYRLPAAPEAPDPNRIPSPEQALLN